MGNRTRPPVCTCRDTGKCGYCPSIAATAYGQGHGPSTRPDRVKASIAAVNAQKGRR